MSDVFHHVPPPPPPPPPPVRPPASGFDFARPFTFTFEDPRWVQKVLLGGLFMLASVFIVGAFFVYGYLARLARNVIAGMQHPLPEWDDLGEYFSEGLRLFCVGFIYTLPLIMLTMVFIIPSIIAESVDNDALRNIGGGMAACVWCLIFPLGLALAIWLPGALLFTAVGRRVGGRFELGPMRGLTKGETRHQLRALRARGGGPASSPFSVHLLCRCIFLPRVSV